MRILGQPYIFPQLKIHAPLFHHSMEPQSSTDSTNTKESEDLKLCLPKQTWFSDSIHLYQGFWCHANIFEAITKFQNQFKAQDSDIILASLPKAGTTWLKSLVYSLVNREKISSNFNNNISSKHPLYTRNPHELVRYFEYEIYMNPLDTFVAQSLTQMASPRLFATHLPYPTLAESIKSSKSRIVYICRNPLDIFVSSWNFYLRTPFDQEDILNKPEDDTEVTMEECFDKFSKGMFPFGPYDEHLLGFWKESLQNPNKVLFLEYEGLKKEPKLHLKRLAEFLGCPFSEEEERANVVDEIIELCSFKSLKEMEVNKSGKFLPWLENKVFFRKGEVGDWINFLTPQMADQLHQILQELSNKAGFSFKYYITIKKS